jgi:hypothetical protein
MSPWEFVESNMERMKIFNGWLVRVINDAGEPLSITFVPDDRGEWKI